MRIARVLTRLNLGGPARQALAADPRLVERGHVVRLFAGTPEPGEGDLFERFRERGIDTVRVPGLRRGLAPVRDVFARRFLQREFASFAPDVVHTHASKAGTLGRQAARGVRPLPARVHTFHGHVLEGYFPALVSRFFVRHESRLARETDRIVAVSHATAEDLLRLGVVGEEKLVVVQPGIELDDLLALPPASERGSDGELRRLIGAEQGELVVGVIGRLAAVKRPQLALDVFDTLAEGGKPWHLVFVGDGSERASLERRIGALSAAHRRRVHLVGAREDMVAVFSDLDLVLATSRSEGLPVALIEAAAAGLPVVATDVGGVAELVAHERTGLLGKTVDELSFHLAALLEHATERQAMGGRARLRVAKRHGADVLAGRLEELYRAVLDERGAAGLDGAPAPSERPLRTEGATP